MSPADQKSHLLAYLVTRLPVLFSACLLAWKEKVLEVCENNMCVPVTVSPCNSAHTWRILKIFTAVSWQGNELILWSHSTLAWRKCCRALLGKAKVCDTMGYEKSRARSNSSDLGARGSRVLKVVLLCCFLYNLILPCQIALLQNCSIHPAAHMWTTCPIRYCNEYFSGATCPCFSHWIEWNYSVSCPAVVYKHNTEYPFESRIWENITAGMQLPFARIYINLCARWPTGNRWSLTSLA